jgi:hypothetical protein
MGQEKPLCRFLPFLSTSGGCCSPQAHMQWYSNPIHFEVKPGMHTYQAEGNHAFLK